MSKKKVTFQTRAGMYTGTVTSKYNTLKGEFAVVKCTDGRERRVRPSQLSPA